MKLFMAEFRGTLARKIGWLPVLICLLLSGQTGLFAQDGELFPQKPSPAIFVHDYSGWLTPDEKLRLETRLQMYEDSTSTEIVVMIRPDIGDYDKAGYAIELGNRWQIGKSGKNNGLVMLIKTEQPGRGVFIASGYGAEGGLNDGKIGTIIRQRMIPLLKEDRRFEGITAGLDAAEAALRGEFQAEPKAPGGDFPVWILFLFIILLFIFISWLMSRLRKGFGTTYSGRGASGRSIYERGGGGWFGGGWGGGSSGGGWDGGSSSGGGGGWSGGDFGGGSFGGGGAGGDW